MRIIDKFLNNNIALASAKKNILIRNLRQLAPLISRFTMGELFSLKKII